MFFLLYLFNTEVNVIIQNTPSSTSVFSSAIQPNPQQGNSPSRGVSHHFEVIQISMQLTSQAGLVQVLSYPMFLLVLILPTHRGMEGWVNPWPDWAGIEHRTCWVTVCCSTNWAIPAIIWCLTSPHDALMMSCSFWQKCMHMHLVCWVDTLTQSGDTEADALIHPFWSRKLQPQVHTMTYMYVYIYIYIYIYMYI